MRTVKELFSEYDWNGVHKIVFWSGGHDSTVALHLAMEQWRDWNPHVVFVDTGITLPETLTYLETIKDVMGFDPTILKPTTDFWTYVNKNGFPFFKRLWCRRLLKMTPIRRYLNSLKGWKINVLGIRRTESLVRKKAYVEEFKRHTQLKQTFVLTPLLTWTKSRVEAYMRKHHIPKNPCYRYYATSGCYFCPFVINPKHYLALKSRHQSLFQKIWDAEDQIKSTWTVFRGDRPTIKEMAMQQHLTKQNNAFVPSQQ